MLVLELLLRVQILVFNEKNLEYGFNVVVDFVCPTKETREAFGPSDCLVWIDRIESSRYENTNKLWQKPEQFDVHILNGITIEEETQKVIDFLN